MFGSGPDGVRTRGRWIKSPSLYLTKLQAQSGLPTRVFNDSCLSQSMLAS